MDDKTKALIIDFHECFGSESGKRALAALEKFCSFKIRTPNSVTFDNQGRKYEFTTNDLLIVTGKRDMYVYILEMLDKEIPT